MNYAENHSKDWFRISIERMEFLSEITRLNMNLVDLFRNAAAAVDQMHLLLDLMVRVSSVSSKVIT